MLKNRSVTYVLGLLLPMSLIYTRGRLHKRIFITFSLTLNSGLIRHLANQLPEASRRRADCWLCVGETHPQAVFQWLFFVSSLAYKLSFFSASLPPHRFLRRPAEGLIAGCVSAKTPPQAIFLFFIYGTAIVWWFVAKLSDFTVSWGVPPKVWLLIVCRRGV